MVFRQFARHLSNVKNFAGSVFNQATRAGGALDKGIEWAKKAYNVVSPALHGLGVPGVGIADQIVNRGYDAYHQLRDKVVKGGNILNKTQTQVRAIEY